MQARSHADEEHKHKHHGHDHGHGHDADHLHLTGDPLDPGYRRVLKWALVVNAAMFGVEVVAGLDSGSVSLLADAVDFAGDAISYGLSLAAFSMGLIWRSRVAWLKGATMLFWGIAVLARTAWLARYGSTPQADTMGLVALTAFAANLGVAVLLYAFRNGDADMRSVWLCTRNDAIGNLAVLVAAAGVFGTATAWPDLAVALGMGALAVIAGRDILRRARQELGLRATNRGDA